MPLNIAQGQRWRASERKGAADSMPLNIAQGQSLLIDDEDPLPSRIAQGRGLLTEDEDLMGSIRSGTPGVVSEDDDDMFVREIMREDNVSAYEAREVVSTINEYCRQKRVCCNRKDFIVLASGSQVAASGAVTGASAFAKFGLLGDVAASAKFLGVNLSSVGMIAGGALLGITGAAFCRSLA